MTNEFFRLVRYFIVGSLATATHFCIAYALARVVPVGAAAAAGAAVGFFVSLTGHHFFTFRSRAPLFRSAWRFLLAFGITAGATALVAETTEHFVGGSLIPVLASIAAGPFISFPLARFWVFRSADGPDEPPEIATRRGSA
ncbi:MAG: GtrA family protein [Parvularculaceae bacterium]